MSPFPNLLHPTHTPSFTPQQNPQQLPTPPSQQQQPPPQQQPQHPPQPHRPLRFLAQILSPYDLTHSSLPPHPTPYPLHPSAPQHSPTNPLSRSGHRHNHHNILAPDFDVRETERAYFLEGEFPGIRDRESVRLEWVDCRTLAIEAKIVRVELENEWGGLYFGSGVASPVKKETHTPREDREMTDALPAGQDVDGGPLCREAEIERRKLAEAEGQKGAAPVVREWLSERRVGHYQRTFTFPADVEAGGVRARLGQGLLRILVPKLRERTMQAKKVEVEDAE